MQKMFKWFVSFWSLINTLLYKNNLFYEPEIWEPFVQAQIQISDIANFNPITWIQMRAKLSVVVPWAVNVLTGAAFQCYFCGGNMPILSKQLGIGWVVAIY